MSKISFSLIAIFGVFVVLMLSGCQNTPTGAPNLTITGAEITNGNTTTLINTSGIIKNTDTSTNTVVSNDSKITNASDAGTDTTKISSKNDYPNVSQTVTGVEGDLIKLTIKAYDPDGFPLTYTYSKPFNDKGLWQTKDGDAGKYLITVTASNGALAASTNVLVIVKPSNKPPVIDCPDTVSVKEGETVTLDCNFFDKEDDPIVVEYSGWMTSPTYTTGYESAGEHKVLVRATDGFSNSTKTIVVKVENVDRAPIFVQKLKDLTVVETDVVTLSPNVTDPDKGDIVKLTFSDPFNTKGVWKTTIGDAGTYPISVVASDGTLSTKESFTLTVKMLNTAPVMRLIPNITVEEGDVITIKPDVKDREDDPIKVTYTGWMTSSTYTTTFDDAYPKGCSTRECTAQYKVTVTASDGVFNTSQDVYVFVKDKVRNPVFVVQ